MSVYIKNFSVYRNFFKNLFGLLKIFHKLFFYPVSFIHIPLIFSLYFNIIFILWFIIFYLCLKRKILLWNSYVVASVRQLQKYDKKIMIYIFFFIKKPSTKKFWFHFCCNNTGCKLDGKYNNFCIFIFQFECWVQPPNIWVVTLKEWKEL